MWKSQSFEGWTHLVLLPLEFRAALLPPSSLPLIMFLDNPPPPPPLIIFNLIEINAIPPENILGTQIHPENTALMTQDISIIHKCEQGVI